MCTFKKTAIVTWTAEALADAANDMLDSALVIEGAKLTVVSEEGQKLVVKNESGYCFPASPDCLQLVE
jgi:hypothetical protein